MLNADASIIAIFTSDSFSFELEISDSILMNSESLIVFEFLIISTDFVDFLSFRERLIAD
jgi:hypothetical protein